VVCRILDDGLRDEGESNVRVLRTDAGPRRRLPGVLSVDLLKYRTHMRNQMHVASDEMQRWQHRHERHASVYV
jgi:hypothetical protein